MANVSAFMRIKSPLELSGQLETVTLVLTDASMSRSDRVDSLVRGANGKVVEFWGLHEGEVSPRTSASWSTLVDEQMKACLASSPSSLTSVNINNLTDEKYKQDSSNIMISFLIEYFRRPKYIKAIVAKLAKTGVPFEIIVNNDGDTEQEWWIEALQGVPYTMLLSGTGCMCWVKSV